MVSKKLLCLLMTVFMSSATFAKVKISSLDFSVEKGKGKMVINYTGNLKDYPELTVTGSAIQVHIPDAVVTTAIDKKVSFSSKGKDTRLRAYQYNSDLSRVQAIFPFKMKDYQDKVSLMIKDNKIELNFPRVEVANIPPAPVVQKKNMKKDYLNEDYLNSLLKVEKKEEKLADKVIKPTKAGKDSVKTTLASVDKGTTSNAKSSFSLIEYGGKFVAFLGIVLLLFYGVISMMKKGFIKKGKLGFLNKTGQVEVLSQTYISPKKSLMLIRAHNQVFLVSNTDTGIHPISEIKDVAGLFKDGEKKIAGNNFDDSLGIATDDHAAESKIKLKENIMESNRQSSLTDYLEVKDKVKFSDQIKKKVKNLKPLQ